MNFAITYLVRKYWKEISIGVLILLITLFLIFISFPYSQTSPPMTPKLEMNGRAKVSPLVLQYEPLLIKYAKEEGVSLEYIPLIEALIQQESGGRLNDVMQSSESIGLPMNTINDPATSIRVGMKAFKQSLTAAGGDIKTLLQSYNFGPGFISFVKSRGGKFSQALVEEFSSIWARKKGWKRYGDIHYVDHVLRYYVQDDKSSKDDSSKNDSSADSHVNSYGFIYPISNHTVTSSFGYRTNPMTGLPELHGGTDFSCNNQNLPVSSVKTGTVTRTGWENPSNHKQGYGQRIYIDYGNGIETVYGHLSEIDVNVGQKVEQGEIIGKCGSTGSSTGMHVHFEIHMNGKKIDPLPYLK